MIKTKKDLNDWIAYEKIRNNYHNPKDELKQMMCRTTQYQIRRYMKQLRMCEYCYNNSYKETRNLRNVFFDIRLIHHRRKKNKLGEKLGIEIYENSCGRGLTICHGGIVVHPDAQIGADSKFHGFNVIGNNGITADSVPQLGNGVDIGAGAKIIGKVILGDHVLIGANAVVNKSFESDRAIAGVPAKILH